MQPIRKLEGLSGNTSLSGNIDGEILAVESYLTLSHEFLFKENEFITTYREKRMKEGYADEILIERWLRKQSDKSEQRWNSDL